MGEAPDAGPTRYVDRSVVVIDDDPTGTQMASDVDVLLRPDRTAFAERAGRGERSVYALSNSRALPAATARRVVEDIADAALAAEDNVVDIVLRGDSTLRGHVFDEIEAVDRSGHGALFVPAWPEGGRVTDGGVHWLVDGGRRTPVSETEFARDPDFGFTTARLADWVHEKSPEWTAATVPLRELRSSAGDAVTSALRHADRRTVVIPDAVEPGDLDLVLAGLLRVEATGRRPVVRSASPFAALRAGVRPSWLATLPHRGSGRVLVLCGSFTELATRQVDALAAAGVPVQEVSLGSGGAAERRARQALRDDHAAVVATSRAFRRLPDRPGTVSDYGAMLCELARNLRGEYDVLVVKGGITSAEVAREGLGARRARVAGQAAVGVPVWLIGEPGRAVLPYVVVPGNVGPERLLLDVVRGAAETDGAW